MTFRTLSGHLIAAAVLLYPLASRAEPIQYPPHHWQLTGSASSTTDVIRLTPETTHQYGRAVLIEGICAKEYRIKFEINLGSNRTSLGGTGAAFFVTDSDGRIQYRVHFDSYFDPTEHPRYELDGNHISIEGPNALQDIYGVPAPSGGTTFGPLAAGRMPFFMEGSGWLEGEIYVNQNQLRVSLAGPESGLVLKATIPYEAGATIYPSFEAATILAVNQHAVRKIAIDVINYCDCPHYVAPLTREEARALLHTNCGSAESCPERTAFLGCVENTLDPLLTENRIDILSYEVLLLETQQMLAYCDGYQRCMSDLDPIAIEKNAYDRGYSDGNLSGIEVGFEQGFQNGYTVGMAEGVAEGHEDGYQQGLVEGEMLGYERGSRDGAESGYEAGYHDGYAQGYKDGRPMTLEEALAYIESECPCSKKRADTVQCGIQTLWSLYRSERISDRTRREAVRSLARRHC